MDDENLLGMFKSIEQAIGGKDARFDLETDELVIDFDMSVSDQSEISIFETLISPGDTINLYHLGAGGARTYLQKNSLFLGYKEYPEGWESLKHTPEIWYQLRLATESKGVISHPAGALAGLRAVHVELSDK